MDEPLSNLDAKLRVQTRAEIAALQQRLGTTTVYVTHDQVEAMTLGHRVAVLRDGVLQQCDTPRRLYEHPCNVFVAGFVGSPAMNLDRLPFDGTAARVGEVAVPLPGAAASAARRAGLSEVVLGLRPDALFPVTAGDSNAALRLSCEVHLVEDTGSDAWVHLDAPGGPAPLRLVARADPRRLPSVGERISVAIRVAEAHVFDPASGVRLGD
jgi:multiple sugar transport system ATP-binding protein